MIKIESIRTKFPFFIMILGLFAISLNTNLIKVALPFFMNDYQIDTTRLIWIAISYTFFQAVFTPVLGKLGDKWDHNKIMLIGYVIFLVGSIIGFTAESFYGILLARSIQGIGAAAVLPNTIISAPAMFSQKRRGYAIGLLTSTTASGAFMGPAVGGLLMEFAGWQSLFLINIPIILLVFTLFFSYVKRQEKTSHKPSVATDLQKAVSISVILGCWIIMLNIGVYYGWRSIFFYIFVMIFLFSILFFYLQDKKYEQHFIDIKLFLNKNLSASFFSGVLNFTIKYNIAFVLPLLMAIEYSMSPGQIGLLLALTNIFRFVVTPFSGYFSDKKGSYLPVQLGFIMLFFAMFLLFSCVRYQFSGLLYLSIILLGAGSGFVDTPAVSTVRANSPLDLQGTIIGFYFSIRYISGITGQIIIGLLLKPLETDMLINQSSPLFNRAFGFMVLLTFLGYYISRALPGMPGKIKKHFSMIYIMRRNFNKIKHRNILRD